MRIYLLFLYGVQLLTYYVSAAPQPMTIYDAGKNDEIGATTWVYTKKFGPFADLTKEGVDGAWELAKRCYDWLAENHGNPGVIANANPPEARAQMVAVTFFPGKKGGYTAALNARSFGTTKARTEINNNAPALKEAIGPVTFQPIHAETLSWLMGEKTFQLELTDKREGRGKQYPTGTITVVYGRRGTDFVIENGKVKMDCNGKPELTGTAPREPGRIEACATSNPRITSCRKIARDLGVTLP